MAVECLHESKAETDDADDALRSSAEPNSHQRTYSHEQTRKTSEDRCHSRLEDEASDDVEDEAAAGKLTAPTSPTRATELEGTMMRHRTRRRLGTLG